MEEIIDNIKKVCCEPVMIDKVIEKMCDLYNVKLDANQYVLVGSTIRSYITYLYENNMVEYIFDGGKMMIKSFAIVEIFKLYDKTILVMLLFKNNIKIDFI